VPRPVPPARLAVVRAVFGDAIPADEGAALRMLQDSPAVTTASQAERAALREAVVALAADRRAEVLAQSAGRPRARPLPPALAVRGPALRRVLSPQQARALFDQAAAMKDVPWRILEEGCIHRAHVVAKRFEDGGVFSEKVFAIPKNGEDLVIETAKARLGYTVVWFHAATVVHVRDEGGARRMVIDPSVADGPVDVETWAAAMHGAKGAALDVFYLPRFASQLWHRDEPPAGWTDDELEAAFAWSEEAPEVEKSYVDSGFYDEVKKLAGR
jgi:hypothetical protein